MIKEYLNKILDSDDLTMTEAQALMDIIMDGQATDSQIAGLLIALKQKGESIDEIAGFVQSMRSHAVKINLSDSKAVDGCGTGGDGKHSFNISTAASLVASAAGATVAKHGNRSVSSKCGSSDLLTAVGGNIAPGEKRTEEIINKIGFSFIFAPRFHPAMKHAVGPRRELGVRTIFNILGPMTNPAGVKRQLIGVYDKALIPVMAEVLSRTGSEHIIVAHSRDGLDEFSISAPTDYREYKNGQFIDNVLDPDEFGFMTTLADPIAGGEADENAVILNNIIAGEPSAYRDAVILNSGVMVYLAGKAESISEGVRKSTEAIDSMAAGDKLREWVRESNC